MWLVLLFALFLECFFQLFIVHRAAWKGDNDRQFVMQSIFMHVKLSASENMDSESRPVEKHQTTVAASTMRPQNCFIYCYQKCFGTVARFSHIRMPFTQLAVIFPRFVCYIHLALFSVIKRQCNGIFRTYKAPQMCSECSFKVFASYLLFL